MTKFHNTPSGQARECSAKTPEACRYSREAGETVAHYSTKEEAQAAYENQMQNKTTPTLKKTKKAPLTAQEQYDDPNSKEFTVEGKSFDKEIWAYDDLKGAMLGGGEIIVLYTGSHEYNIKKSNSGWDITSYKYEDGGVFSTSFPKKTSHKSIDDVTETVLDVARNRYNKVTSKTNPTDDDFRNYLVKGRRKQARFEEEYKQRNSHR